MPNTNTNALRNRLLQINELLTKANGLLEMAIQSQPKLPLGKPPQPYWDQRIETKLWNVWDKLKAEKSFIAADAKRIATGDESLRHYRSDSAYSAILSRWAREGYLEVVDKGTGPNPTIYKVPATPNET